MKSRSLAATGLFSDRLEKPRTQRGMTLPELLVVLAIMGLGVGMALVNVRPLETPLKTATALTRSMFRQARLEAIATTSAYRVVPAGNQMLTAEYAGSCLASSWTQAPKMAVELPQEVTMAPINWSACFSSRGISSSNVSVTLTQANLAPVTIEVLLGGTTRVVP